MASVGVSVGLPAKLFADLNRIAERDEMSLQDVIRRACMVLISMDGRGAEGNGDVQV